MVMLRSSDVEDDDDDVEQYEKSEKRSIWKEDGCGEGAADSLRNGCSETLSLLSYFNRFGLFSGHHIIIIITIIIIIIIIVL